MNLKIKTEHKRSLSFYLSGGFQSAGGLIATLIMTRFLTPEEFSVLAIFGIFLSIFDSFSGLNSFGIFEARFFRTSRKEKGELITALFYINGSTVILTTTIVLFIYKIFNYDFEGLPVIWVVICIFLSGLKQLQSLLLIALQYLDRYFKYLIVHFANLSVLLLGLIMLFYLFEAKWYFRYIPVFISSLIVAAISIAFLSKNFKIQTRTVWSLIHECLFYGLPLIPHKIAALLLTIAGQIIISKYLKDPDQLTNYFLALKLGVVVMILNDSLNKIFGPQINKAITEDMNEILKKTIIKASGFIVLGLIAFIFITPLFIGIILPTEYSGSIPIIPLIAIGYAFHGIYSLIVNISMFKEKTKDVFYINIVSGITAVVVMISLAEKFEATGIAVGFLVGQIIKLLLVLSKTNFKWKINI